MDRTPRQAQRRRRDSQQMAPLAAIRLPGSSHSHTSMQLVDRADADATRVLVPATLGPSEAQRLYLTTLDNLGASESSGEIFFGRWR